MSVDNKRIARNTLALYFRMILTVLVTLYTSRIILTALGVSDFGLFGLVGGVVLLLGFLNAAMVSSIQRFLNFEKGTEFRGGPRTRVFATGLGIQLLLALGILVLAETLGLWFLNTRLSIDPERLAAANWVYQCAILSFLTVVIMAPYNAVIVANERMSAFAYISILDVSLKLALALALVHLPGDKLKVYAVLTLLASVTVAAVYALYALRNFSETRTRPRRDRELFGQMLSFSSWSILSNLSVVLRLQGTNIALNLMFGTLVNAAFGLAMQVGNTVQNLSSSFIQAINPQIVKTYAAGDLQQMHRLVLVGCRLSFFLVLFFVLPALLEAEALLRLWLVDVPQHTTVFVQLVLIQAQVESFAGVMATAQGATGRVRLYHMVLSATGLMNLPVSYFLLRAGFAPQVVFQVAIVLSGVICIIRLLFLHKSIELPIGRFLREVALPCAAVVTLAPLLPLLARQHVMIGPPGIIVVLGTAVLSILGCVALLGLTRDERGMVTTKIMGK